MDLSWEMKQHEIVQKCIPKFNFLEARFIIYRYVDEPEQIVEHVARTDREIDFCLIQPNLDCKKDIPIYFKRNWIPCLWCQINWKSEVTIQHWLNSRKFRNAFMFLTKLKIIK